MKHITGGASPLIQIVVFKTFCWLSVLSLGIWVGGTLFHMLVVQPMWNFYPPYSVKFFFTKTRFNATVWNFYGPPFMVARLAPLIICIVAGWNVVPSQRTLLLIAGITWMAITACTLIYIYPINDVLFLQAGGDNRPEQVRTLVNKWLFADRLRFAVATIGYLCLLRVFNCMG